MPSVTTYEVTVCHRSNTFYSYANACKWAEDRLIDGNETLKRIQSNRPKLTADDITYKEISNPYMYHAGYSDNTPYEIIKVNSDRMITIREMDATLAEGEKPEFIAGGFAGHCTNQHSLKWDCTSNEENSLVKVRLHKDGIWRDKGGSKYYFSEKPQKFHDYNF